MPRFGPGLLLLTLLGCSFRIQGPPPNYRGESDPMCEQSSAEPVIDGVIGSVFALGAVGGAMQASSARNSIASDSPPTLATAVVSGVLAVPFLVSTVVGATRLSACKAAHETWSANVARRALEEREQARAEAQRSADEMVAKMRAEEAKREAQRAADEQAKRLLDAQAR